MGIAAVALAATNVLAFAVLHHDKRAAAAGRWRIRERTLLALAAAGGSPAILVGMAALRHKTRKTSFRLALAAIIAVQAVAIVALAAT